ncbi:probable G-protein coupled receptor 139 [Mobula hypostoma]|uniref:probable G-protein coupled receptor 139 n=1 Tax=Mobula hypostoma TaxID=723540 RepID=UPI002FC331A7
MAAIGVPVNLLAIIILPRGKCGLSTSTTRYLVAMAVADLLVIITEVILSQIKYHYFPLSFLDITPVCAVIHVLRRITTNCSVWFTVTFTFDRFVAICCQKLKTKYCTGKTAAVVQITTGLLLCLKNIPFYFATEPGKIIDNLPWFCGPKPSYFTDKVRHILVASRVWRGLRGQSKRENSRDPEMENRKRSVILLFTLSGSFILLWLTVVVEFVYYQVKGTGEASIGSENVLAQVGYALANVSCCTNTFIYAVTQSKFREQVDGLRNNSAPTCLHSARSNFASDPNFSRSTFRTPACGACMKVIDGNYRKARSSGL